MLTKATVISVEAGCAIVETERRSACDGCHKAASGGCAMCTLMGDSRRISARAADPIGVHPGDIVEVETAAARLLGYAALVFLAPILLAAVGYLLGGLFPFGQTGQIVAALLGFAAALAAAWCYSRHVSATRCDLTVVRVIAPGASPDHD